jgi:hypothetical protein
MAAQDFIVPRHLRIARLELASVRSYYLNDRSGDGFRFTVLRAGLLVGALKKKSITD